MGHTRPDWSTYGYLGTLAIDANGYLCAQVKGIDGTTLRTLAVDDEGRIIMVPYGVLEVSGDVDVTQTDKTREVQGKDGVTLRTLAVDASGQLIMVPRGQGGNYLAVDANGYLGAILKAAAEVTIPGGVDVTQTSTLRQVQGKDGVTYRDLAVDASGQLVMVPKGQSGNYLSVDASGFLTAVMKGLFGATFKSIAVDTNGKLIAVVQGADGATLRNVAVDGSGQIIMVPRGSTGNYMTVDASGFLSAILKGQKPDTTLGNIAVDASGQIIMVPRGQSGNYMSVDSSGNLAAAMKGLDGTTLRTVAVDANGNIVGVFKGEYAGALKTLATDAGGRLIAILSDPADIWGVFRQMGLAELAVRLGSICSFDRRGDLVWMEDFESGLGKWLQVTSGVDSEVLLSAYTARDGAYSCKLKAGAAVNREADLYRGMGYPVLSKFGLEVSFALIATAPQLFVYLDLYDGTNWLSAGVWYAPSTDILYYWNSAGNWQVLASGLALYEDANWWHTLKLVVDFANTKYVRVILNDQTYSLEGIVCRKTPQAGSPSLQVFIGARSEAVAEGICYVDNIIITQNEA